MEFFRTKRLIIRNVEEKDVPVIYDYRNSELCARYQRGQVRELNEIKALVENRKNDVISAHRACMLAVALRERDEMVGEINVLPAEDCISLGYTVSYKYHRQGFAFEALSTLIERLHAAYPNFEFISFTEPENQASMALLQKLGYVYLGYSEKLDSEIYGKWVK